MSTVAGTLESGNGEPGRRAGAVTRTSGSRVGSSCAPCGNGVGGCARAGKRQEHSRPSNDGAPENDQQAHGCSSNPIRGRLQKENPHMATIGVATWPRALGQEPAPDGLDRGLGAIRGAELLEGPLEILLHRADAPAKPSAD